jgi:hypothetical protein
MKLLFAFFADAIVLTDDGRFHVLNGSTSGLKSATLPTTVANLGLLARFSFDSSEFGKEFHSKVKVVSPTGAELNPPLEVTLRPGPYQQHPERPNVYTVHYRYDGFTPIVAGEYKFVIYIDDEPVGDVTIDAILEQP